MRMKHRVTVLLVALALGAPVIAPPAVSATAGGATAVAAKACGSGYTHAVIGGAEKCLRRGQFCAHRYDRQYKRYGFRCVKTDRRGNYHLT
jgi:hypothetical protein